MSLFKRLRDADPAPDEDRLLASPEDMDEFVALVKERAGIGQVAGRSRRSTGPLPVRPSIRSIVGSRPPVTWRFRGPAIGVATAVAVLVGGLASFWLTRSGQSEPMASPSSVLLTGTEGSAAAEEAFVVVEEAYRAFRSGDIEAWVDALMAGLTFDGAPDGASEKARQGHIEIYEGARAIGETIEVVECVYDGYGEWSDFQRSLNFATGFQTPVGHKYVCETVHRNAFHGAAGIELEVTYTWISDGGRIQGVGGDITYARTPRSDFAVEFEIWLGSNHPDVSIAWRGKGYPAAEDAAKALDLVGAFIEESSDYPIEP